MKDDLDGSLDFYIEANAFRNVLGHFQVERKMCL